MRHSRPYAASFGIAICVLIGMLFFAAQTIQPKRPTIATPVSAATTSAHGIPATTTPESGSRYTLIVAEKTYTQSATSPESVITLMQSLASTTDFRFTAKAYPSLGLFIESINGAPNAHEKYWMLYINGTQSQFGVSSAPIHPGDVIEWRFE